MTCIMPTKDRRRYIDRAVRSFLQQTHGNRELLVLDDGKSIEDLLPDDPRIRYVRCDRSPSLGAKRNLACELARGEYIAHWDDDDWSAPERLSEQLANLPTVAGYRQMLFWDERKGAAMLYAGEPRYVLGTSLIYRADWWREHRFNGIDVGEDNDFIRRARAVLTVLEGVGRMVATTHANGTSPRAMGPKWKPMERAAIPEEYWQ